MIFSWMKTEATIWRLADIGNSPHSWKVCGVCVWRVGSMSVHNWGKSVKVTRSWEGSNQELWADSGVRRLQWCVDEVTNKLFYQLLQGNFRPCTVPVVPFNK